MPCEYEIWGKELIDANTIAQMDEACGIDVAVEGALMPDAHLGYGLPIGGVLATENQVIPYAVGVDIACRMHLTVFDEGIDFLDTWKDELTFVLNNCTKFGMGCHFKGDDQHDHEVLDNTGWRDLPKELYDADKLQAQLGTSGGGNHFVEFGEVHGRLALLSHSGSRGTGYQICKYYSDLAKERCPEGGHLAWLDLDTEAGQEYWLGMTLAGEYAKANHECIHARLGGEMELSVHYSIDNHHNFAWKENGLIVHRKGATPAAEGERGVIPGTMRHPTFIVEGKGNPSSLYSAAHGAGRTMSRTQAKKTVDVIMEEESLSHWGVNLLSAGVDELPASYKNIYAVMNAQIDLVEDVGLFWPKLVKMAGDR